MLNEGLSAYLGTSSGALAIGIGRVLERNERVITSDLSDIAEQVASFNVISVLILDEYEMGLRYVNRKKMFVYIYLYVL